MDRLTYWNHEYGCWSYRVASGEAAKRLAAYEDTGLTPEEINLMKADSERRHKLFEEVMSVIKTQSNYAPCPDCGGGLIITDKNYYGLCLNCGHKGKVTDSPEEAIKTWNEQAER